MAWIESFIDNERSVDTVRKIMVDAQIPEDLIKASATVWKNWLDLVETDDCLRQKRLAFVQNPPESDAKLQSEKIPELREIASLFIQFLGEKSPLEGKTQCPQLGQAIAKLIRDYPLLMIGVPFSIERMLPALESRKSLIPLLGC